MAISLYLADWPFAIFKVLMGEHRDDYDREITVIAHLVTILGECDPAQRIRILRYLHSLYSTPPSPPGRD